jgi:O-antigen/teichoic acid export membrane protein
LSGIRVTYAGLISFTTGILSIVTGLSFIIIVTRMLTPIEYGVLGIITSLLVYSMVFDTIVGYWARRDIARGIKIGKTAIASSGIFSIFGIIVYYVSVVFIGTQPELEFNVLLMAIVLVPLRSFDKILSAINGGWRPQVTSYANLVSEIIKIPLGLIFLYFLEMKIDGVILTLAISLIIGILIQSFFARHKIVGKFSKESLKRWIKFIWIPITPKIFSLLRSTDVIVFSIITGSIVGIAYYSASLVIASLISGAGSISGSVVTKLLESEKRGYMEENFRLLIYFLIPFTAFALSFSRAGLFVLNPIYEIASMVVVFLTFQTVLFTLSNTFSSFLYGVEDVDKNIKSTYKDYFKSKLFFIPVIRIIQYGVYLIALAILLFWKLNDNSDIELVVYWSILSVIVQIPITTYLYFKVRKTFELKLDILNIAKYCLVSSLIFGLIFIVIENHIEFNPSLFEFIPSIIILAVIGFICYIGITFFIDSKTRTIGNLIIQELKNKINKNR